MKGFFLIFSLLLLSSCTLDIQGEKDAQIKTLEQNISQLKAENQRIAKENTTLSDENKKLITQTKVKKAETIQSEFGPITPLTNGFSAPEEMDYKEVTNEACIKKAEAEYIKLGDQQCKQMGLTEQDIKENKCKLTREFIDVIQKKLKDAVDLCGPGY
ncbi:hypothetical protein KBC86_02365 [Candidatus Gracilibacteria bacterium]|nr:hypothetical protein [Candidatus Gracilibacteria bacterium]